MKKTAIALALGFAMTLAAVAQAAQPTPGTYNSIDIGGAVQMGRASHSWALPNNASNGNGDVFNYQSWDGVTLGAQWIMSCGASTANQTVVNNLNGVGTGTKVFTTNYTGGTFFFSRFGPWGDGINDLTGVLLGTSTTLTIQYVNFIPTQRRGDFNTSGYFNGSHCDLTFAITNLFSGGDTQFNGGLPANYPPFLDPGCGATRANGNWTSVKDITIQIDCVVPTTTTTWSGVKSLYR